MKIKKIVSEWNDQSFKGLSKRWGKPYNQTGTDYENNTGGNKTLSEGKFREGDIVVPNVGLHKGVKHTIIYDFGDGRYNIQPIGLRPKQIQYALGAAGASEDQLKKVGSAPQKPAPSIIDTSDYKPGDYKLGKTFRENKTMKLKDILNERPISRAKVGGQLGQTNLKSNIDQKWTSTEDMENDLRSWLEATFEVSGPALVREIGLVLKEIGISAIKDGTTGGEDRPAGAASKFD